jgi:glycolate oxidase iron-sulfur subunit
MKLLYLGKRSGISRLLNRAGILRRIDPRLAAAEEMVEDVPAAFLRDRPDLPRATPDCDVVYFLACGPNFLRSETGEATLRALAASGLRHGAAANACCGLPGVSYGDLDAARALAAKNIEELEKYPAAVVLVDDSSCAAAVKDYPGLFDPGSPWRARAEAVSRRTRDFVEWAASNEAVRAAAAEERKLAAGDEAGDPSRADPAAEALGELKGGTTVSVTYHDPCKARYGQKIVDPPRDLLRGLPGVDLRELPEADQCCGGGGTYSFVHPEISRAVLDRKVKCALSTGARTVLTSSASCLLQTAFGLRRAGSKARVLHLAEFLFPPRRPGPSGKA